MALRLQRPVPTVGDGEGIEPSRFRETVDYDVEILKPALLLADRVILRTWRLDTQLVQILYANRMRFAVPMASNIAGMLHRDDNAEWGRVGIGAQLHAELKEAMDRHYPQGYLNGPVTLPEEFFEEDAVGQFVQSVVAYCKENHEALEAHSLRGLIDEGTLEERPWVDTSNRKFSAPDGMAWTKGLQQSEARENLLAAVNDGNNPLLFDPRVAASLPQMSVTRDDVASAQVLQHAS